MCASAIVATPFQGQLFGTPRAILRKVLKKASAGFADRSKYGAAPQGWLGSKDTILHSGEGPLQDVKWSGSLIAWANDLGVKVYDTTVHQHIAYVERPKSR